HVQEHRTFTVASTTVEVIQRHAPAIVALDVVPPCRVALREYPWPAAGRAVVEPERLEVDAAAGAPVVREDVVAVDVAAAEQAVAVGVPRCVLIEVDVPAAKPARRPIAADLQPVADRALVGTA